ncbi:GHKL domain-containing protein [Paenibacillus nicotianae]|uniref:GHKL domain-containing protein n=1 Tax=Paenibacillus nicotianae TaxID=1526551 RepID=A0ABW4UVU6_9BACL
MQTQLLLLNACIVLVMGFQINFYFNAVFGKSNRAPNQWVYFVLFGVLDFFYLNAYTSSVFSSVLALIVIFILSIPYQTELKMKIVFSILYAVLLTLVNFISLYILYPFNATELGTSNPVQIEEYVILSKSVLLSCLMMFVIILVIRFIVKRRSFPLHYRYYLLFLTIPAISIYQVNVLSMYSEKNVYYFISIFSFLFLNVFIIYILDNMIEKFQLIHENIQLQDQMDYQDANYEKTVHSFKQIKRIIHDTHQQFLYIEQCIEKNELDEAKKHIQTTLNKVEDAYQRVNTGNLVVDALVTNALNIGQANGIQIDTQLQLYSQHIQIERYDLCVVLGNMLDNAIEASKKINIAEDRYILIRIQSTDSHLSIHILNHTIQGAGQMQTQKSNPEFHGIGLTNIDRICNKYGGNMTIEQKHHVFNNMVILPFQ